MTQQPTLKGWHPGALIIFGRHWNGNNKPAALGLVISVELVNVTDGETGRSVKHDCINAIVWDHDGMIHEIKFANISAWEPIA